MDGLTTDFMVKFDHDVAVADLAPPVEEFADDVFDVPPSTASDFA